MGYIRNHAIVVSATLRERITVIHGFAKITFGDLCSGILPHAINGGASFFVGPDGSKEHWNASDDGDTKRAALIEALKSQHPWLDWAEIVLGGDDNEYSISASAADALAED